LLDQGGVRSWVGQDKPDAYATIGLGGDERTTVVAKNSVQHTWEEWYEFPLEELDGHIVEVNMYDKDKMSKDEFLGYAAIDIRTFSQVKHLLTHTMTKTGPAQTTLPVTKPIQTRLVKAVLESVPGRKTKYSKITGKIEMELAWQPLVSRPGPPTSLLFPGSTAAVLTVFIYSANNLAKYAGATPVPLPVGHLPSAQATLTVASYIKTTGVSRNSQQAEFKQGFTFLLGTDWKSQSLQIEVADTEKRVSSFGKKTWRLADLLGKDIKQEIVSLDPKIPSQTITLSANIRFPGI